MPTDRLHRVELRLSPRWGSIDVEVKCDAGPDAWCRQGPSCMCDREVDEQPCNHPLVPGQPCTVRDWLDGDVLECYAGETTTARDGAIVPEWDGEGYAWRYADPLPEVVDVG